MLAAKKIVVSGDTLDNAVYLRLKEMIINREIDPDELIIQNKLSELLGVSRTPLRKAMGQLESEGLLTRSAKGWYIKEFTEKDMVSVFEIRAVLEGLACRLVTGKLELADFAFMRAMFEEAYNQFKDNNEADPYYAADVKFHNMIIEKAADPLLIRTISNYKIIATSLTQGLYRDPRETYHDHIAIIDALKDEDANQAEFLMREHVRKAIPLILAGKIHIHAAPKRS